jgi:hypothetical protein
MGSVLCEVTMSKYWNGARYDTGERKHYYFRRLKHMPERSKFGKIHRKMWIAKQIKLG